MCIQGGMTSISLPMLGCGRMLQYPVKTTAETMMQTACKAISTGQLKVRFRYKQIHVCFCLCIFSLSGNIYLYYIHVCVQWYSQLLRWFPILALVSGSAPSICKHDLSNIRLGNSVIFTTKGWENHITDNNVIITTSTTTLFSFFSLQQQVTFVAYSPSEYDALTHVLRQTNSGASCGSAASSNAGTLPNVPLKNHWVCKRSFQVSSI